MEDVRRENKDRTVEYKISLMISTHVGLSISMDFRNICQKEVYKINTNKIINDCYPLHHFVCVFSVSSGPLFLDIVL